MAKHTPGPWKKTKIAVVIAVESDHDFRAVADCRTVDVTNEEANANARLIAAAPDLLALARAYEAWEADLVLNGDWSGSCVRMTQSQHDRMIEIQAMRNAAVAKATGK